MRDPYPYWSTPSERLHMARERQRTLPPLEMDCYDPGQNIPLEFALAIKRAVCFAAVGGALFIALVIGSAYHVFIR